MSCSMSSRTRSAIISAWTRPPSCGWKAATVKLEPPQRRLLAALLLVVGLAQPATAVQRVMVFGDSVALGLDSAGERISHHALSGGRALGARAPGRAGSRLRGALEVSLNGRTADINPAAESMGMAGAAYLPAATGSQMPLALVSVALGTNDLRQENH